MLPGRLTISKQQKLRYLLRRGARLGSMARGILVCSVLNCGVSSSEVLAKTCPILITYWDLRVMKFIAARIKLYQGKLYRSNTLLNYVVC